MILNFFGVLRTIFNMMPTPVLHLFYFAFALFFIGVILKLFVFK